MYPGQRETREKQKTEGAVLPRAPTACCCAELASTGRLLCLSTELQGMSRGQGLDSSVPVQEERSQLGVMGVSRLSEVRLDLCPSPNAQLSTGSTLEECDVSEGVTG